MKPALLIFTLLSFFSFHNAYAQADTSNVLQILDVGNKRLEHRQLPDGTVLDILAGNVRLKHGSTYFSTDSCVLNANGHVFEAFGHVYINDSDTTKIWSNYLRYMTDTKMAHLTGNVKLSDGHATLTTSTLDYDVANKIGTYKNGGRVVNRKTVLTSGEGMYYADLRDFYFRNNVVLKDPAYTLRSDSLLYNTETQMARFIASTYIKDSSGRVIRTKEGYYDVRAGRAEFSQRTTIQDKSLFVSGDKLASDNATGIMQIQGNGVMIDTAKGINLLANKIFIDRKRDALLATQKPVMTIKQKNDSFFIAADTLFSARLSDLYGDASKAIRKNDSTNRYIEAYRNVRVFSDSMQSISDSLFYSFKDSVFRLYQNPVVWSNKSQITGDTIYLFTKNQKADRVRVFENSFLVTQVQPSVYNQVKASRIDGYFKEGSIDSVRAKGFAESVYFLQDKDSAFTGVNRTASDAIDIYFQKGDLYKIVLRRNVKGDLLPVSRTSASEMRLPSFIWLDARRPKSKYELFE
jgi:lipopolysaccharide export system protein LptA